MHRFEDPASPSKGKRRTFRAPSIGDRGAIAIQTAVILAVLLGFLGLGVEISLLLFRHRQMQTAADTAALAGANALNAKTNPTLEAHAVSGQHGFSDGVNGASVRVYNGPIDGPHVNDTDYVEVIVAQPQALVIGRLFSDGPMSPAARAVAHRFGAPGEAFCVLSTDTAAANAIEIRNNVILANPACGIASNSTSSSSIHLHNNAVAAGPVATEGDILLDNGARLTSPSIVRNGPETPDPYADVVIPANPGGCTAASYTQGQTVTLNPGCYSSWTFDNASTVHLASGTYWVTTSMFLGNNVTVDAAPGATGVTVIVDGDYAISLGNKVALSLVAPTTGDLHGLALIGARSISPTISQAFLNNNTVNVVGAIYFPTQTIIFNNNVLTGASRCTQVVARIIKLNNNATFNYDCQNTGIRPITPPGASLVE